jgi:hypothetical protein
MLTAGERISGQICVERRLELAGQISSGDAPKDLAVVRAQTRVASPTGTAAFLEELLTDTHAHQSAPTL